MGMMDTCEQTHVYSRSDAWRTIGGCLDHDSWFSSSSSSSVAAAAIRTNTAQSFGFLANSSGSATVGSGAPPIFNFVSNTSSAPSQSAPANSPFGSSWKGPILMFTKVYGMVFSTLHLP